MNLTIQKRTACNRDCPDACGIIATVTDGKVTRLQGDPDHPVTQGFLCHRTSRFLERQYAPDRLTQPLVRRNGGFIGASWDEALGLVADSMLSFRDQYGAASILHYRCGGSLGIMKHVEDYFFERFGPVTVKSGDVCAGAGEAAQRKDFGCFDSSDLFDVENSKTIVLWGKNVFVSSVHLIPLLKKVRQRGARLVLIDPVCHRTASICDRYIQPRAGGDAALAMGMARWLLENQQYDQNAPDYCDHFEPFREMAFAKTLAEWATIADVDESDLIELASCYADGPSSILVGWGMQRRRFGATTIRTIDALTAISGNLGIAGGGVSFYFARRGAFDFSFGGAQSPPRTIPEPLLGPGILAADNPPIQMVWVSSANPVAMLPESNTVADALKSRKLTVVVDSFLTDTARCADVVLPTTTLLEDDDLLGAYGHHWLIESRPVIDPPAGVKSDYEIIQRLAQRVGLGDEFQDDVAVWKRRLLKRVSERGIQLEDFRRGPVKSPFAREVLFADRKFDTATGKVNLIHELPKALLTPASSRTLQLAAFSTEKAQASQWPAESQIGPATAIVHPDAIAGFQDGDVVWLESDVDSMEVRLKTDRTQRPDVVLVEKGGWHGARRCANALIKAELTDDGECAVYYDTTVRIRKAAAPSGAR